MTQILKIGSTLVMAVVMALFSPIVLRKVTAPAEMQISVPERVSSVEAHVGMLEQRVSRLEDAKLGEQLAEIRQKQIAVLTLLGPVALFMFTHSWETWQRLRGNSRTRKGDRQ